MKQNKSDEQRQTVSVSVTGFEDATAYAVDGQIAITLGGFPANLTAYLSPETAAALAELITKACRHQSILLRAQTPAALSNSSDLKLSSQPTKKES